MLSQLLLSHPVSEPVEGGVYIAPLPQDSLQGVLCALTGQKPCVVGGVGKAQGPPLAQASSVGWPRARGARLEHTRREARAILQGTQIPRAVTSTKTSGGGLLRNEALASHELSRTHPAPASLGPRET